MAAVVERQQQREIDEQVVRLIGLGKANLSSGNYRGAATNLSRALELRRDNEVLALLEQAQKGIGAEIEAQQGEEERQSFVAQSLRRAGELEVSDDLIRSLNELQAVAGLRPAEDPEQRRPALRREAHR